MNFRERINEETLSLRKNRYKKDLFIRRGFFINDKSRHLICPLKLRGIDEKILEYFRIKDEKLEETIQKTFSYLNSKELEEIKFGSFLLRRYFSEKVKKDEELNELGRKLDFHIDIFIENGLIPIVGKVLNNETSLDILTELTWALVNLTYYDTKKNGYEYIKDFINPIFMEAFYKLINMGDNEITTNLYNFLENCILESDDFAKNLFFSEEDFIKLCLKKYLEPSKSIVIEHESKKACFYFLVSFSKLSNLFNEKQKNTFYIIYEKLLEFKQFDPDVLFHSIAGLKSLFCNDKSEEKMVFNLIKKNNFDIFDKLFFAFNEVKSKDENFYGMDKMLFDISIFTQNFILLAEEKDIIILLQNTQLLNFIEFIYDKIFYKKLKNCILEILVMLSHHTSTVVLNMINGRDSLLNNLIKNLLISNSFDIRAKGVEIIYNMLNLNSLDINVALFRTRIIDQLITVNLVNEEDSNCLKNILNGILIFINSIKFLENQSKIEIINNLIKIGISNGLENNITRFNYEHNIIIKQINEDIKNILNCNENQKDTNNFIMMKNQMQIKEINNNNNNFVNIGNNENKSNNYNII